MNVLKVSMTAMTMPGVIMSLEVSYAYAILAF